jgi:hypothetical protein
LNGGEICCSENQAPYTFSKHSSRFKSDPLEEIFLKELRCCSLDTHFIAEGNPSKNSACCKLDEDFILDKVGNAVCVSSKDPLVNGDGFSVFMVRSFSEGFVSLDGFAYKFGPSGYNFSQDYLLNFKYNGVNFSVEDNLSVLKYKDEDLFPECNYSVLKQISQYISLDGGIIELDDVKIEFPFGSTEGVNVTIEKIVVQCFEKEESEEFFSLVKSWVSLDSDSLKSKNFFKRVLSFFSNNFINVFSFSFL